VETPEPVETLLPNWEQKRIKERVSLKPSTSAWQLDMTAVTTEMAPGAMHAENGNQTTFEVEMELTQEGVMTWLESDTPKEVSNDLAKLVEMLMPRNVQSTEMDPVTNAEVIAAAAAACHAAERNMKEKSSGGGFPGAQPVGMRRGHIRQVLENKTGDGRFAEYWVAEKTDGVRYLLAVVSVEGKAHAVFVDRKMDCYTAPGMDVFAACFPAGTVLDGEIVQNRTWKRLIFMVFDILTFGETSYVEYKFSDRYKALDSQVVVAFSKQVGNKMPEMPLVKKKWYRRKEVSMVLGKMRQEQDGSICYRDSDSRHHKSDGLILVPDRHYARGTDFDLLKYKEGTTMTLDFKVAYDPHSKLGIQVWFDGPNQAAVDFTGQVSLPYHDRQRLYGDMGQLSQAVCEFAFNPEVGKWEYELIRHDKDRSNYYITILDTIAALAENVTQDELEFKLLCSSLREADDQWSRRMKRATDEILKAKRKELQQGAR